METNTITAPRPDAGTTADISGEIRATVESVYTTILECETTGGVLSLAEMEIPAGGNGVPRLDCGQDAVAYVIEGRFTVRQGECEFEVKAGDFLFVPGGDLAGFDNTGTEKARILLMSSPERASLPPYFVPAGGARHRFDLAGMRVCCKAAVEDTHGAFSFFEAEVQPGSGVALHVHSLEDETFYILSGRFELWLGDQVIHATPGTCLFAPQGIPHAFQCVSEKPGRMIGIASPGGIEHMFADIDAVLKGLGPFLTVDAIVQRHGIRRIAPDN